MKRGVHRVTPTSEAGRRMISIGRTFNPSDVPPDIRDHNERIDERRRVKQRAKAARRAGK
jgi:hypothetical protein